MSYSIAVNGHSRKTHNEAVLRAVAALIAELEKVEDMSGSISGYTWDSEARIELNQYFPKEK